MNHPNQANGAHADIHGIAIDAASTVDPRVGAMRHLISAMMLGQMHGCHDDASTIYGAATEFLGEGQQLRITLAFASAMGGDAGPANALLAEGVEDWPNGELATVSLSLALKLAGDPEWKTRCEHALAVSVNSDVRSFANAVLENE